MKVLFLDAYNLIYRAKSGFMKGDNPVIFNFFRGIRPLVEMFDPDLVYFVLEGRPAFREHLSEGQYKANRSNNDQNFHRQKAAIINIVKACMPFKTVRHPEFECDDTIATLSVKHAKEGDECTIISSDSDFIQLLNFTDLKISLYNPVKKKHISVPDYDYVTWKALRGDPTDNISGIKGIGDKTATKIVKNHDMMVDLLKNDEKRAVFERNVNLIRLVDFSDGIEDMECHIGKKDFDELRSIFEKLEFSLMLKESTWEKYKKTFERVRCI